METHLRITGSLLVLLSLVHCIFPAYFNWKKELSRLSLINRQMMQVHTFFLALFLLFTGLLCITSSKDLIRTLLGHRISLGLFIFWSTRLIIQFVGYSPRLWKGKKTETIIHIIFSVLWAYISIVFLAVYMQYKESGLHAVIALQQSIFKLAYL